MLKLKYVGSILVLVGIFIYVYVCDEFYIELGFFLNLMGGVWF